MIDWGEASRALVECTARGDIVRVRSLVLDVLDQWMPFDGASFYTFTETAPSDRATVSRGSGGELLTKVSAYWATQCADLEGTPIQSMSQRGVVRLDDMGPARETPTFREVFAPAGVTDTLTAYIAGPEIDPRLLVLVRHDGARFSEAERDRLGALHPFLCLTERSTIDPLPKLPLTAGQRKIVDLVRYGLTNDEIAQQLRLSPRTVRNQLSAAYERCGVTNRTELVASLTRRGR